MASSSAIPPQLTGQPRIEPELAAPRPAVLLLDDDTTVREGMRRALRHELWDVIATPGCQEALQHLHKPELALVITDLRMAPIDGWDFLFHCRIRRPSLPVFVVSGVPLRSCGGADHWATAYFQKPVDLEMLLTAVRSQLQASFSP